MSEWSDLIDTFARDAGAIIRTQPVTERLDLIDDLKVAAGRIVDDLIAREVALLAEQGYAKSRIAHALGCSANKVDRIVADRGITIRRGAAVPADADDLRDTFTRADQDLALPDAGYRA